MGDLGVRYSKGPGVTRDQTKAFEKQRTYLSPSQLMKRVLQCELLTRDALYCCMYCCTKNSIICTNVKLLSSFIFFIAIVVL